MKERLFGIIQAMDPKADMRKLERIFDKFNKIFKGNLDSMDKDLNRKENERENLLDKIQNYLTEAKTGGATYEVGIIMGWHNIVGKKYLNIV